VKVPEIPPDEAERLADLRALEVLDSDKEPAFERITALAATLFDVPIAVVSLVDEARQWFKSKRGLDVAETTRDVSFCGHAILDSGPFVIGDALEDPRFVDNPLVTGSPHVRFYAGAPLTTPRGHRIGTLCLLDRRPRSLTDLQRQVLEDLAGMVMSELELRAARRSKTREASELQALLAQFPAAVLVVDRDNIVRFNNAEVDRMLGYQPGELVGRYYTRIVHPDEREQSMSVAADTLQPTSVPRVTQRRLLKRGGELLTAAATVGRLTWGGQQAVVVALRDITGELREQVQRENVRLQTLEQLKLLLTAFDVLPVGVVLFDPSFRCVYANKALTDMLGVDRDVVFGRTPDDAARYVSTLTSESAKDSLRPGTWRALSHGATATQVFALVKPRARVVRRTLHRLESTTHPYLALWTDITHEAAELARSEIKASTDPLTQLPNRRAASQRLTQALNNGGVVTLVMFDIDHFKRVNDSYGHAAGDELLRRVARALQKCAREGDMVARWGGEEFVAIVRGNLEGARTFAERARRAVLSIKTEVGPVTVSAGIAQGAPGVDAVQHADEKLYEAKRSGRNRVCE
jgi:diguanylate cyclase (GGDEF)-like protein/PAS domain S-box-containing protein